MKQHIEKQAQQRQKIQAEIKKLTEQRNKYIAQQRKKQSEAEGQTLGEAVIKAIRVQAGRKNFQFQMD